MNSTISYDLIVYNGRFSPCHKGHVETMISALQRSKKLLIIVGSAQQAPNSRNPWTEQDRINLIKTSLHDAARDGKIQPNRIFQDVIFGFLPDYPYNNELWRDAVRCIINRALPLRHSEDRVGIIGYKKDTTSWYLDYFPELTLVEMEPVLGEDGRVINATQLREHFFTEDKVHQIETIMSPSSIKYVEQLNQDLNKFERIKSEFECDRRYKRTWQGAPYPVITVAGDAVVTCLNHVLLVTRGKYPGKGLLALPGGHLELNETLADCAIRELMEETQIALDYTTLSSNIVGSMLCDYPNRSTRGRVISHAYHIKLDDLSKLPEVEAADDAMGVQWLSIQDVIQRRADFFEDHYSILANFIEGM